MKEKEKKPKKPMSKGAKVALGVAGAAVLGSLAYGALKKKKNKKAVTK